MVEEEKATTQEPTESNEQQEPAPSAIATFLSPQKSNSDDKQAERRSPDGANDE